MSSTAQERMRYCVVTVMLRWYIHTFNSICFYETCWLHRWLGVSTMVGAAGYSSGSSLRGLRSGSLVENRSPPSTPDMTLSPPWLRADVSSADAGITWIVACDGRVGGRVGATVEADDPRLGRSTVRLRDAGRCMGISLPDGLGVTCVVVGVAVWLLPPPPRRAGSWP
jgi:hypothetical protein